MPSLWSIWCIIHNCKFKVRGLRCTFFPHGTLILLLMVVEEAFTLPPIVRLWTEWVVFTCLPYIDMIVGSFPRPILGTPRLGFASHWLLVVRSNGLLAGTRSDSRRYPTAPYPGAGFCTSLDLFRLINRSSGNAARQ